MYRGNEIPLTMLQAGMRKRSRGRRPLLLTWWRTVARDHVTGYTATRFSCSCDLWMYVHETIDEFPPPLLRVCVNIYERKR